jgi:hypothetical protein
MARLHGTPKPLLAALLGAAIAIGAQAGRPLQTEDAGVLERGQCELEGAAERLRDADGARARGTSLQFGCGIGLSTQVALNASRAKADGERTRGLAIVGKTGLWTGPGDEPAQLTLAWGANWIKPDGERRRHESLDLNLVYSRPLPAELTLHANLGHTRDRIVRQRTTSWGLAIEHAGFGSLAPMAEVFGDDREAPWWNLGLRWTAVLDHVYFDMSYGRQVASGRPRLVTVGFKFAY